MSIKKVKCDQQAKKHDSRNETDASQQVICELGDEELELVTGGGKGRENESYWQKTVRETGERYLSTGLW